MYEGKERQCINRTESNKIYEGNKIYTVGKVLLV